MAARARKSAHPKSRPVRRKGLVLRLYVAGSSPNSLTAIANLKAVEARCTSAPFELEIVDVLQDPRRALADAILVTPTLIKLSPTPACRILGNLRDTELVLRSLGLPQ